MEIYINIPRPPSCRAVGTWPPGSRAAGVFPQKNTKNNYRQVPGNGRPAAGRPAPLAALLHTHHEKYIHHHNELENEACSTYLATQ